MEMWTLRAHGLAMAWLEVCDHQRGGRSHQSEFRPRCKPKVVLDYNSYTCIKVVNRSDHLAQPYPTTHRSIRWYKMVLPHLLDMAVSAFIVYKALGGHLLRWTSEESLQSISGGDQTKSMESMWSFPHSAESWLQGGRKPCQCLIPEKRFRCFATPVVYEKKSRLTVLSMPCHSASLMVLEGTIPRTSTVL